MSQHQDKESNRALVTVDEYFLPKPLHPRLVQLRQELLDAGIHYQTSMGKLVWNIVDDIIKAGVPTSLVEFLPFIKRFTGLRRQKQQLRQIVSELLSNLLDPTLQFEMTLGEVIEICFNNGAELTPNNHGNIYRAILKRLRTGSLRDYCVQNGLVSYLNYKLEKVNENYQYERSRGTIY